MSEAITRQPVQAQKRRRLLLFSVAKLEEMLAKGNVWYARHYETWFDDVEIVYLHGYWPKPLQEGRTRLVSLGGKRRFWWNLLVAPFRLYAFAKQTHPTHYLTADIVFSWWTALLLRLLNRAPVVLMPVCIPDEIYRSAGRSLSGLPIWLERVLLRLSYAAANRVIMGQNLDALLLWLRNDPHTRHKLQVVPAMVEEFPSAELYEALRQGACRSGVLSDPPRLLYVGRLHREKLVTGLIDMLAHLHGLGVKARLVLAGDGPERSALEQRARQLGIHCEIEWLGFVPNRELATEYRKADVFLSTVTGTALREAGLFGVPVVGYNADWVQHLLKHEDTALLVPVGDAVGLAREVARVLSDHELRQRIADNFSRMAWERWDDRRIRWALQQTFEPGAA